MSATIKPPAGLKTQSQPLTLFSKLRGTLAECGHRRTSNRNCLGSHYLCGTPDTPRVPKYCEWNNRKATEDALR